MSASGGQAGDNEAVMKLLPGPHALLRCLTTVHPGKACSTPANTCKACCVLVWAWSTEWYAHGKCYGMEALAVSQEGGDTVRALLCMLCSSQHPRVACTISGWLRHPQVKPVAVRAGPGTLLRWLACT